MNSRHALLRTTITLTAITALVFAAGCATDDVEEEDADSQSEAVKAVKSNAQTKGETCCALCNNRKTGKDLGKADGCRARVDAYCSESGRGGVKDAQWVTTCGK